MKKITNCTSTISAFSLVEIALTLGIVAITLVPILGLLSVASKQNFDADSDAISASIASDLFSQAQQASFEQIERWESTPPDYFFDNEGLEVADSDDIKVVFSARMIIKPTQVGSEPNDLMKQVTVWVSAAPGDTIDQIEQAIDGIESEPDKKLSNNIRTFQSLVTQLEKTEDDS